jgi:hypothetical protein
VLIQQTVANRTVDSKEELFDDDLKASLWIRLGDRFDIRVLIQHIEYDIHEVLEGVLVEIVDYAHAVQCEENSCRHFCEWFILICHFLDFLQSFIRLGYLLGNYGRFTLDAFKFLNQLIIFQDFSFCLV